MRSIIDRLECRCLLSNITVTSAYLIDGNFNQIESPVLGEEIGIRVEFETSDLPSTASYSIEYEVGGVPLDWGPIFSGAGSPTGSFRYYRTGWYAEPGSHTVTVTVDSADTVSETNESDNSFTFDFTSESAADFPQKLIWPVEGDPFTEIGITNYVDIDPTDGIGDYVGGNAAYNGHNALDAGPGDFYAMDAGVEIYAAADGIVTATNDGEFDRVTAWSTPAPVANYVIVDHGDGWETVYWHLRRDSVEVTVGQAVSAGDVLGLMGSSGFSTDVHIHFGLLHHGRAVEPFMDPETFFVEPQRYVGDVPTLYHSGITNYSALDHIKERPSEVEIFSQDSGQVTFVWGRFNGLREDDVLEFVWHRPDNSVYSTSTINVSQDYSNAWWLRSRSLPAVPDLGQWRVEFLVNGTKLGEGAFTVTVDGAPEVLVEDSDGEILHGLRYTPVDFGQVAENSISPTETFTVFNHGSDVLTLGEITVPDGFRVTEGLPASLPAGGSDTFTVGLVTDEAGYFGGQINVLTNDADEEQHRFSVEGTVERTGQATLVLGIGEREIDESGQTVANIRRTGDLSEELNVTLTNSDDSQATAPMTLVIPPDQESVLFFIDGIDENFVDGEQELVFVASAPGFSPGTNTLRVADDDIPELALGIAVDSLSENGGVSEATVSRNTDTTVELVVTLATDDEGEATVPNTVTIPVGEISATFEISGVDDGIVDGTQIVSVAATADAHASATDSLEVTDDDSAELTLEIAVDSISENGGVADATISRNSNTSAELIVSLSSDDTGEATVPDTVTIPAGESSATFEISAVDDLILDGIQVVTIVATASDHAASDDTIEVTDDDVANLTLEVALDSITEGGGVSEATISRNTDTTDALVVTLTTDDVSEATVPTSVTIPAGETSATFEITGVEDAIVDGTQVVTVSASADGLGTADVTIQVTDNDVAELTLEITLDSISESGVAEAAVTRNTDTTDALTVVLVSNDVGEAAVPDTVTIPAGEASVLFEIVGVDDGLVDGAQVVEILATADDHASADDTIEVTDENVAELSLGISVDSISENGGTADATVFRNTDTADELVVTLSSNDTGEATVSASVTIPAGERSATFGITAVDDLEIDGTQLITIAAAADGHLTAEETIEVTDDDVPELALEISMDSMSENGGVAEATVTRNSETTSELVVTLSSNDPSEAAVSETVTIAAGESSVAFEITALDDAIVDGAQLVAIVAMAENHRSAEATIEVTDDDVAELTLEISPDSISENGGVAEATVYRNTDTTEALVVTLVSSDVSEATVPETLTLPAGERSFVFEIVGADDTIVDGAQLVEVIAMAEEHAAADGTIEVTDDDSPTLTLVVAQESISENGGVAEATIFRNADTTDALVVTLVSNDLSEALVPEAVTIPAGESSFAFEITAVDDDIVDGTQLVELTATAEEYASADAAIEVRDDDGPILSLQISVDSISENGGSAQATVSRNADTTEALIVSLASSDLTEATVPETVTIPAGESSVVFEIAATDDAVVDGTQLVTIVATAAEYSAGEDAIEVTDDDDAELTLEITFESIGENGGVSEAVVFRNTDTAEPLVVVLSSDDVGEAVVPETVTIPADESSVAFEISGVDDSVVDGTQVVVILAEAESHFSSDDAIEVTDDDVPELSLEVLVESMNENGGVAEVVVYRNSDTSTELVVTLSSDDEGEASAPETVTIPAGESSVAFEITGVDDTIVDGTQIVGIVAIADEHATTEDIVEVTDDDVPVLTLEVAIESISENGGVAEATVARNTDPTEPLVVTLISGDVGEAVVAETVTIPAGKSSATFVIEGVDDSVVDGEQVVSIVASADEYVSAEAAIEVTDDDEPGLVVEVSPESLTEDGGIAEATIFRNTDTTEALVVTVSSDNPGEIHVPETVTIPAGEVSISFVVEGVDDSVADGTQSVLILASALDFVAGEVRLDITDDEMGGFIVSETNGKTVTHERGGSDEVSVVLAVQPIGEVVIDVTSTNRSELATDQTSLTFTPADWDVAQLVVVSAIDEGIRDGDQETEIVFSISEEESSDPFDSAANHSVSATTLDDDGPVFIYNENLFVIGTTEDDAAVVAEDGTDVTVDVNGEEFTFGMSEYKKVIVSLGSGSDSVDASSIGTRLLATMGDGSDTVLGGSEGDSIRGGKGRDSIVGNDGDDTIKSGAGADTLEGNAGHDDIGGSGGGDSVSGGSGQDILRGGGGLDFIYGGKGADTINGGGKSDTLEGGSGSDLLIGGRGADELRGGKGDDLLVGENGNDILDGGTDRDLLLGGQDKDTLNGGDDEDLIIGASTTLTRNELLSIQAEWSSDRSHAQRLSNVRGAADKSVDRVNTAYLSGSEGPEPQTVFDDEFKDHLSGNDADDVFFAVLGDRLRDRLDSEWLELL